MLIIISPFLTIEYPVTVVFAEYFTAIENSKSIKSVQHAIKKFLKKFIGFFLLLTTSQNRRFNIKNCSNKN